MHLHFEDLVFLDYNRLATAETDTSASFDFCFYALLLTLRQVLSLVSKISLSTYAILCKWFDCFQK